VRLFPLHFFARQLNASKNNYRFLRLHAVLILLTFFSATGAIPSVLFIDLFLQATAKIRLKIIVKELLVLIFNSFQSID
jgi:hypothetical protein